MVTIVLSELIKVVEKAINHTNHTTADENSPLSPEAGALVRDVGKDRAIASLQLRRSLGSISFAENLAKCISSSEHRRKLKK